MISIWWVVAVLAVLFALRGLLIWFSSGMAGASTPESRAYGKGGLIDAGVGAAVAGLAAWAALS